MPRLTQLLVSTPSQRRQVPVLAYHFTGREPDAEDAPYTLSPELFDAEMRALVHLGYRTISLKELHQALATGCDLPQKAVVITFDDGRACFYQEAFPVLRKYGLKATVFLISSRLAHPNFISQSQVREMQRCGIEFGSHGHDHQNMGKLSRDEMIFQATHSKAEIEKVVNEPISAFAFPYGGMNSMSDEVLRDAGYDIAVCSKTGFASVSSNRFQIPRLGMRGTDTVASFIHKLYYGSHSDVVARFRSRLSAIYVSRLATLIKR